MKKIISQIEMYFTEDFEKKIADATVIMIPIIVFGALLAQHVNH